MNTPSFTYGGRFLATAQPRSAFAQPSAQSTLRTPSVTVPPRLGLQSPRSPYPVQGDPLAQTSRATTPAGNHQHRDQLAHTSRASTPGAKAPLFAVATPGPSRSTTPRRTPLRHVSPAHGRPSPRQPGLEATLNSLTPQAVATPCRVQAPPSVYPHRGDTPRGTMRDTHRCMSPRGTMRDALPLALPLAQPLFMPTTPRSGLDRRSITPVRGTCSPMPGGASPIPGGVLGSFREVPITPVPVAAIGSFRDAPSAGIAPRVAALHVAHLSVEPPRATASQESHSSPSDPPREADDISPLLFEKLLDEDWWYWHLEDRRQGGAPPDQFVLEQGRTRVDAKNKSFKDPHSGETTPTGQGCTGATGSGPVGVPGAGLAPDSVKH